ncbi:MAG: hypothetical protein MZW92_09705 [Comamonadaceae bacterium]|nr:hypothetical protein [Comamonadaceae bacterium]
MLDWELSTLGHPLADFAYHCMVWRIPPGTFRGLGGLDLAALGIPVRARVRAPLTAGAPAARGIEPRDWEYYMVYNLFRIAAIVQGVAWRVRCRATPRARRRSRPAARARPLAELAWRAGRAAQDFPEEIRMDFEYSPRCKDLQQRVARLHGRARLSRTRRASTTRSRPTARAGNALGADAGHRGTQAPRRAPQGCGTCSLPRVRARRRPHQPRVRAALRDHGPRAPRRPRSFNCSAPDTGNMEVLGALRQRRQQKREWLDAAARRARSARASR